MNRLGTDIGPYTLVSLLGEGGMGTVYLAEQRAPIRRQVALKLVRQVLDSPNARARLAIERDALARLDHPHIARAFDAGITAENQPYVVMELVRGESITTYCERVRLGLPERMELFATVCHAVHHAHTRGVLHRDIKPSNILVVDRPEGPEPKVIDFGLAKSIEAPLGDAWSGTRWNTALGTVGYMSPEQASPERGPVDQRSDVYSLGCVLYELLTGEVPLGKLHLDDEEFDAVLARLLTADPKPPSAVIGSSAPSKTVSWSDPSAPVTPEDTRHLAARLQGDLDYVALKAVHRNRDARYGSALVLAEEIRRYLRGEPVSARPERRPQTRWAMACVLAATAVGLALAMWSGNGRPEPHLFMDSGQTLGPSLTRAVAVGDLNGDGHPDAVFGNRSDTPNFVFLNDGSGRFADSGQRLGVGDTYDILLLDVEGDGDLDLVVGNAGRGAPQPDEIWVNDGKGRFTDSGQRLGRSHTRALLAVDVDGDRLVDLVQGNWGGEPNRIYRGRGNGRFEADPQQLGDGYTESLAAGDLDGDGDTDLVEGNLEGPDRMWINAGDGTFRESDQTVDAGATTVVRLFDCDGDGDLDLFVGRFGFGKGAQDEIWRNERGRLQRLSQLPGLCDTTCVVFGDIDRNGTVDMVVGDANRPNRILLGDGRGGFRGAGLVGAEMLATQDLAFADVDRDGRLDLLEGGVSNTLSEMPMPSRLYLGR